MTGASPPGDGDVANRLSRLPPEKRALLERALLARREVNPDDLSIPRRPPDEPAPLSFPQQRLWFLDKMAPGDPTYNAVVGMRLRGPVDVDRLRSAFEAVVLRHEAIRTVLPDADGRPYQQVLADWQLPLPVVDLRGMAADERAAALMRLMREEPRRSYDLQRDLMMRLLFVQLADDDAVLLLMEHHIAFDGWSDEILCAEVSEVYAALGAGRPPALKELPIQYGDFAAWQRKRLDGEKLEQHQAFWRDYLAGAPALLPLPTDLPRPAVLTHDGARVGVAIGADVLQPLGALCKAESATPYMVLISMFGLLLHRWAGVSDICVGTPIANRSRIELERLIGFFSNTIAIRIRPQSTMTMREFVRSSRDSALAAYAHQDLPFDRIVEAVAPPRDLSHNPLFCVNFRVTDGAPALLALPDVECSPVAPDIGFARFDLALELQVGADGIGGYLEYNLALFKERTARALVDALGSLLEDALRRPDVALATLAMSRPNEGPRIRRRA
jgi:hypothetical protein